MPYRLSDEEKRKIVRHLASLPGKRGIDIPPKTWDAIHQVASGITRQIWGRPPTPEQMDWLHKTGAHTPETIHAAFMSLPHPHAPQVSLGDFQSYADAYDIYRQHSQEKPPSGR